MLPTVAMVLLCWGLSAKSFPEISIVTDPRPGTVARHGVDELTEALENKGVPFEEARSLRSARGGHILVVGSADGNGVAAILLREGGREVPRSSEALTIWNTSRAGKPVTVIAGHDDRGTMYAALEVADRIRLADDPSQPLKNIREVTSEPHVKERGIAMYTMHRGYWESRFYDEAYWERYFDMMAASRLNMLEILFGYENGGFMAPCYPYFFDVEGFPEVRMEDITPREQARNVEAMHRLMKMAHDRGIGVRLGVWDHIYTGGVQAGGNSAFEVVPGVYLPWQVQGLEVTGNLIPYTKAAFAKLLRTFPEMDAVLFKTNNESGLKTHELHDFSVSFLETMKAVAPDMRLDIHSKGLTDTLINTAAALDLDFRVAPKFWMEQMGLPFHPSHINREDQTNRRHGYADMLRYPQKFNMLWKLWNGGTNRAFLWGDADYVRRFAESSRLYGSSAYAVYEPFATKMEAQFHDVEPFELLNPEYRYYDYEFERWWYFFALWGRVGYDPDASEDMWRMEFARRFGEPAGEALRRALEDASRVMPRVVAACLPYIFFPTTSAWPEKQRLGDLSLYSRAEGSDISQFASFDEEARVLQGVHETGKILPSTTSRWFAELSGKIDARVAEAVAAANNTSDKEFVSTVTDLKMLSLMALYHSRRIPAAVSYCIYKRTGDPRALDEAIAHEQNAVDTWARLVETAGDVYSYNMLIGRVPLSGHWRDELDELRKGIEKLKTERANYSGEGAPWEGIPAPRYREAPMANNGVYFTITHEPVESAPVGEPITVEVKVAAEAGVKWVRLQYRPMNQYLDYITLPMVPTGEKDTWSAVITAGHIDPERDMIYFIEMMDGRGHGFIYPDLETETPYVIVTMER